MPNILLEKSRDVAPEGMKSMAQSGKKKKSPVVNMSGGENKV